ncbi:16S rRNA (uracil(1498)-N(3))-methyltransferase [Ornithinibacillus bavariensis]|uniref:Ribosomal RNA small subunit methyltransferase E n=1 Tax=Ornithinibacillus bavariensis TaxID=545502 RepID=A0A919X7V1_9BACI|nr:16S rRNA (uracil(1498)-N(3))-methyltransferase [Ornithinibacillus bavariensis]GIO27591.1 ribosomal RNA small subunit methyltransferase E [Ornithinibacillus bavariensis]
MQRYFIPKANWQNNTISIEGDDAHHIIRVMRMQAGDKIICNKLDASAAICEITELNTDSVTAEVLEWLESNTELPVNVTIAQGLPKGDKIELVLQKGTELGAYAFIPFQAERSVVKWDARKTDKKLIRFSKIVKEASEQSHRNRIPEIRQAMNLSQLIQEGQRYDIKLFAYEEEAKTNEFHSFSSVINQVKNDDHILICIGPEGGFSQEEVTSLKQHDFIPVRLGPRILRTETAALYALSSISYHLEELGGTSCQQ